MYSYHVVGAVLLAFIVSLPFLSMIINRHKCKQFVFFRSLRIKQCIDCGKKHLWELGEGQKSLITSSKDNGFSET